MLPVDHNGLLVVLIFFIYFRKSEKNSVVYNLRSIWLEV